MLKDLLMESFKECDRDVQKVISEVLILEQAHISMERPRIKNSIKQIIDRVVQDRTGDQE